MKLLFAILATGIAASAFAQESESIILKAMNDELTRNMSELHYEGFAKPFYISYSITDVTEYNVASAMGGILRSGKNRSRGKNIRVLVGDYEFNDESLDNNNSTPAEPSEIQLPLDDDYYGIRRSLWITTDYIYKSAARQYKKNLETLAEKNKTIADLPHRRFAAQPKVTISESLLPATPDLSRWEKDLAGITEIFTTYPDIEFSGAYLSYIEGYSYFLNSEGSTVRTPVQDVTLQIYAQRKTAEGEPLYQSISYNVATPQQVPAVDALKAAVHTLCKNLGSTPAPKLDEEYTGPVLIRGEKVADLMSRTFFSARDPLVHSDLLPDPRGYRQPDPASSIESRIGKLIVNEKLTVTARSRLRTYQGTSLRGAYSIDAEGVVPPAELVLIENGVLKGLLNNRSLIKPEEIATGHSDGPGVVEFDLKGGMTMDKLKDLLIAEAKKERLEYALIIEQGVDDQSPGIKCIKVYTSDGKEEVVSGGVLAGLEIKDLKSALVAWSSGKGVYNLSGRRNPSVTSCIVNDAILLTDIEVEREERGFYKEERFISNPLSQK